MLNLKSAAEEREPNDELLRTRIPRGLKEQVEAAAALLAVDTSAFVRRAIAREARETLAAQTHYTLSDADAEAFANALDTPPAPTPAALRAAARYRARVVHAD